VRAQARDDQSAEQLRAVVNGAIAAGKMMAGNDHTMAAVLNSLQSNGTGKNIEVSFSLPPEVLDSLGAMGGLTAPGHGPGHAGPPIH
jgi:hypothetical protein